MYHRYWLLCVSPVLCFISSNTTMVSKKMGGHPIISKYPISICSIVSVDNGLYWYVSACIACVYVCICVSYVFTCICSDRITKYKNMYSFVLVGIGWFVYICNDMNELGTYLYVSVRMGE